MHIKREKNRMIMSEGLVCPNYADMSHYGGRFEQVGDQEYQCQNCGTVMVVKDPVLVLDHIGMLKMQVVVEGK